MPPPPLKKKRRHVLAHGETSSSSSSSVRPRSPVAEESLKLVAHMEALQKDLAEFRGILAELGVYLREDGNNSEDAQATQEVDWEENEY